MRSWLRLLHLLWLWLVLAPPAWAAGFELLPWGGWLVFALTLLLWRPWRQAAPPTSPQPQAPPPDQEQANLYALLLDALPLVIYLKDDQRRLVQANRAYFECWQTTPQAVLGKKFEEYEFLPPELRQKLVEDEERGILRRQSLEEETFEVAGRERCFLSGRQIIHLSPADGKSYLLGFRADVSEQKKLEKMLQQGQKMEALGRMAGGIAHDFNNLLFAIILNLGLAQRTPDLPEKANLYLRQAQKAGEHAKELVEQILTFSRMESGDFAPLSLEACLLDSLQLIRSALPKNIDIHPNLALEGVQVEGDKTQLHQIMMNLASNAQHAMRQGGGRLIVEGRWSHLDDPFAELHGLETGDYAHITITDTGEGMNRETLTKAFDPFFTTKPKGEGTGMGLALVHSLVKKHRGSISCYSEPGKGTSFNLFLPLVQEQGQTQAPTPLAAQPATGFVHGGHVLLVDDEQMLLDAQKRLLEHLGYRVSVALHGQAALELFLAQPDGFDLVITDQTMPVMTGSELAQEILSLRPDLPVILATGFSHLMNEAEARSLGIRHLLKKPVLPADLTLLLEKVLRQQET